MTGTATSTASATGPAPADMPGRPARATPRCRQRDNRATVSQAYVAHTAGACDRAVRLLAAAHTDTTRDHGHGSRDSLIILAHLGHLYATCGWHDLARRCHGAALTAAVRYLPPGDDLPGHLAAMARQPVDATHTRVCRHHPRPAPPTPAPQAPSCTP
ncbi:hypothetical protein ACQPYA_04175 [Micromonospora sp. CA-263727]|uniref:hypothetical protein n=1 Tax=Micromonospora sp. CA-263727 TaxID=3239967 RepID=UPI003D8C9970